MSKNKKLKERIANAKKKDKKNLTFKQKRFCHALVKVANQTEAARLAGYSDKSRSCSMRGMENMKLPHVQNYIKELLAEEFPEGDRVTAGRLRQVIEAPVKLGETEDGVSPADLLKYIQYYHKLKGYEPATKTAKLVAHVNAGQLPSDGE